jgi:hypothetical protein
LKGNLSGGLAAFMKKAEKEGNFYAPDAQKAEKQTFLGHNR